MQAYGDSSYGMIFAPCSGCLSELPLSEYSYCLSDIMEPVSANVAKRMAAWKMDAAGNRLLVIVNILFLLKNMYRKTFSLLKDFAATSSEIPCCKDCSYPLVFH